MKQHTIKRACSLSGLGLHSGQPATVTFTPASEEAGIFFVTPGGKIPARVDRVQQTKRGTTLGQIAVVEHMLAAVYGLGLDNLQIELTGPELPALDGSSQPYVVALQAAGICPQAKDKNYFVINRSIKVADNGSWLAATAYHGFKIEFMVDFPVAGQQRLVFDFAKQNFAAELAPARTFGFLEELALLKEQGLAQGASVENALVVTSDGYLNQPRFPDELVRHKILDLIGDLALLGKPLQAQIKAVKSGHKLNVELVRRIWAHG